MAIEGKVVIVYMRPWVPGFVSAARRGDYGKWRRQKLLLRGYTRNGLCWIDREAWVLRRDREVVETCEEKVPT